VEGQQATNCSFAARDGSLPENFAKKIYQATSEIDFTNLKRIIYAPRADFVYENIAKAVTSSQSWFSPS
jgi:hypothetical protein